MATNKLILRALSSPWVTPIPDVTKGSVLTHVELDNNQIYLRGEIIHDTTVSGNSVTLHKINGNDFTFEVGGVNSGLESVTESSQQGWRLIGRDPTKYGNIGTGAIDFSHSTQSSSTTRGSTGTRSVTFGVNNDNPYNDSIMFGTSAIGASTNDYSGYNILGGEQMNYYNNIYTSFGNGFKSTMGTPGASLFDAVVYSSILVGHNSNLYAGRDSAMFGHALSGGSVGTTIVGVANDDLTTSIADWETANFNAYGPRFIVGTGNWNPDSNVGSRANGLVVMSDGEVTAPSLTIAKIDAEATGRALVTREYLIGYSGGTSGATPTGLERIDEGNGDGWRLIGRDPLNYGNIGLNSIDLSSSSGASSVYGATGENSLAVGKNNQAAGNESFAGGQDSITGNYSSFAFGYDVQATGDASFAANEQTRATDFGAAAFGLDTQATNTQAFSMGRATIASGSSSFAGGDDNTASSYGETALGLFGTIVAGSAGTWVATDRLFGLGNGTLFNSRSDAFILLKNGLATLPSVTNALIDAEPTGKAIVTREYLIGYSGGTSGATPTGLERIDEGNGDGWRLIGRDPLNYGDIGLNAIDFSHSTGASSVFGSTNTYGLTLGEDNRNNSRFSIMYGIYNIANSGSTTEGGNLIGGQNNETRGTSFHSVVIGAYNVLGHATLTYPTVLNYYTGQLGNENEMSAGFSSFQIGSQLLGSAPYCTTVGVANADVTSTIATPNWSPNNNNNPRFIVGNGTRNGNASPGFAITRSNALEVWQSGDVIAPSLTIDMITTGDSRTLVTKEYLELSGGTGSGTTVSTDDYTTGATFNPTTEILEFTRQSGGTYNVELTGVTNTGLELLDEGNGDGWRLIGRDPANYGPLGLNAIDFSRSTSVSSIRGGTGTNSVTFGTNTINPFNNTLMYGQDHVVGLTNNFNAANLIGGAEHNLYNNIYSSVILGERGSVGTSGASLSTAVVFNSLYSGGKNNLYAAHGSGVIGNFLLGGANACTIVGQANEDITNQTVANISTHTAQLNNPRFIVGTGIVTGGYTSGSGMTRRNGLVVWGDGGVYAPTMTNSFISGATSDVLVTRNYLESWSGGTGSGTTNTQIITGATFNTTTSVLELEDTTNTDNVTVTLTGTTVIQGAGDIGVTGSGTTSNPYIIDYKASIPVPIMRVATLDLTASEVRSLGSNPMEIVPAPGVGKALEVFTAFGQLTYVAPAFNGGGDVSLMCSGATAETAQYRFDPGFLALTASTNNIMLRKANLSGPQIIDNAALVIASDDSISGGSSVKIQCTYRIVDL